MIKNVWLIHTERFHIQTIQDLLRFSPAKITVFGVDFYSTSANYNPTYVAGQTPWTQREIASGLRVHDPLSNFLIMRAMHKAKVFDADNVTGRALALDQDGYASHINRLFGDYQVAG
jgi:hypothetical protein